MTRRQQAKSKRKKRPPASRAAEPSSSLPPQPRKEELEQQLQGCKILYTLMEAFDSISLEEAAAAYKEANGDVNKAAEILANMNDGGVDDDPSTSSISSGGLSSSDSGLGSSSSSSGSSSGCSGSSEGFMDFHKGGNKQKRMVAITGTVSTVLGKDYLKKAASPRRDLAKGLATRDFGHGSLLKEEEAEQFLCSMLGDDCELSMGVVRDVLGQCGHDVEKALEVLLSLSASSIAQSGNRRSFNIAVNDKEDVKGLADSDNLADGAWDCSSHSSECEANDSFWGCGCRDYMHALTGLESPSATDPGNNESDLPQKVLESLFNISKSPEHEPSTMNWRNVVKKMQSLGPGVGVFPSSDAIAHQNTCAKGDDYHLFRSPAKQHWDSRKSYLEKAASAYSNGNREYAAYLSDQGRIQTKLAQVADERASQDIFKARNKDIENVVTIDLHGQHVKPAMRLLKLHLLFGTYVRSIQTLRVITGCGSHGVGKSKLKQSVINLLVKEGIEWKEENRGVVLIKLDGFKQYSFLDTDSDTD